MFMFEISQDNTVYVFEVESSQDLILDTCFFALMISVVIGLDFCRQFYYYIETNIIL